MDLAAFLGKRLTPEQVASIVQHCDFDSMNNNENTNKKWLGIHESKDMGTAKLTRVGVFYAMTSYLMDSNTRCLFAGQIGNRKKYLTVEVNERMDGWIAKEFQRLSGDLADYKMCLNSQQWFVCNISISSYDKLNCQQR